MYQPENHKLSKAESSRINGASSNGPKTDEGRANSANARLKHGAYSKRVLMDGESSEGYDIFKSSFLTYFLPADPFETECVDAMVTARWRIRRLESTETANLNIALDANKEKVEATFDAASPLQERALAVQEQMSALDASTRVQERLYRIYDRNYKLLSNHRRKSGRHLPVSRPENPVDVAEPPIAGPSASEPPAPAGAILTDDPTAKPGASHVAASLATKIAMFLVIFALSFLTPAPSASKSLQPSALLPAFHAPARSAASETMAK
jgi:hypothetical protein